MRRILLPLSLGHRLSVACEGWTDHDGSVHDVKLTAHGAVLQRRGGVLGVVEAAVRAALDVVGGGAAWVELELD